MAHGIQREAIESIVGSRFTAGNRVELLHKGLDSLRTVFDSVRSAESLICLEFYIYRNDETGRELAEILKQKASEGVRVYLLYDHFGSFFTPRSFWDELRKSGVNVAAAKPFMWGDPFGYMRRDHKKLIIVDGHTAFTGGLNIANEYRRMRWVMREAWRDTGIIARGPSACAMLREFSAAWKSTAKADMAASCPPDLPFQDGSPTIPIFARSSRGRKRMRALLYYLFNHSVSSITITTAYFTPSWRMIRALEKAVERGVRVRLLVPGESDMASAYYAGRAYFTRLLRSGIGIHEYRGTMLHAKTYVFDAEFSIVGSANLDFQSLRRNDEGNLGIMDAGFSAKMLAAFDEDLKNSEAVSPALWRERPLRDKALETFFSLFRRRL